MSDVLKQLDELAEELAAADLAVETAEADLDLKKEVAASLAEVQIPELMEGVGLTEFKTEGGLKIKVIKKIRSNISEANRNAAFNWLREHGHNAMIKRALTVLAQDDDQGQELSVLLSDYDVSDKATVPWQTLDKFVTEMLEEGEDIPQDLFGVYRQQKAKVTR